MQVNQAIQVNTERTFNGQGSERHQNLNADFAKARAILARYPYLPCLTGPGNAALRALVMSLLTGTQVKKSAAAWGKFRDVLYVAANVRMVDSCEAAWWDEVSAWARDTQTDAACR